MSKIQDRFDNQPGDFFLEVGEYEGPLIITRSCIVDGSMSTLWAKSGPVLLINAAGVTIKNLRVEVTEEMDTLISHIAIQTEYPDTILSHVEVNGDVVGFANEAPIWDIPLVLSLGTFAANKFNSFSFCLNVPTDANISCSLKDIKLTPNHLIKGENLLFIEIGEIKNHTILYGEIMVTTHVSRRIYITGRAELNAPEHRVKLPLTSVPSISGSFITNTFQEPVMKNTNFHMVVRGQRISTKKFQNKKIQVLYEYKKTLQPIEIDGYVFLLQADGKVHSESNLIFFGNQSSPKGEISMSSNGAKTIIIVDLEKVESQIDKIIVSFSVYGDNLAENFSLVDGSFIQVIADKQDYYHFVLSDLNIEKTIIALEIYRYKGEWKIHFVGVGYYSGLRTLCESYGIEVQ